MDLASWVGALELGTVQMAGPLSVLPLFGAPLARRYLSLDEGLALGAVVRELPEPAVNRVLVDNPAEHPILLLDGEAIVGAQQDRIVDGTCIVPARTTCEVAVCCVEQGRWDASMRHARFDTAAHVAPPSLRTVARRSARSSGRADQHAVWSEVRTHVREARAEAPTGTMTRAFEARSVAIEPIVRELRWFEGQVGFVVAAGSRVWALELALDPAAFSRVHPRLLRGYALDALRFAKEPRVCLEELREVLARVLRRPLEAAGEGRDRFGGRGLRVEGLAVLDEGRLVAASALLPGAPQGSGVRHPVRTSETDPIEVGWIAEPFDRLGITMAPGKRASSLSGAPWRRDLELDLLRLRYFHRVDTLVCLLPDAEMEALGIRRYEERARAHGMEVLRLPIPDGRTPSDAVAVRSLVRAVRARLEAGRRVVVHCRGGLGRAGTISGCVLVGSGVAPEAALELLVRARGPSCPENEAQRAFVRSFAARSAPATRRAR